MGASKEHPGPPPLPHCPRKQKKKQRQQQQNYKNSLPRPSHPAKLTLSKRKIYQYHYEKSVS